MPSITSHHVLVFKCFAWIICKSLLLQRVKAKLANIHEFGGPFPSAVISTGSYLGWAQAASAPTLAWTFCVFSTESGFNQQLLLREMKFWYSETVLEMTRPPDFCVITGSFFLGKQCCCLSSSGSSILFPPYASSRQLNYNA